jgi:ribosomal protein S18 acetylase RimI-like enzyme
LNAIAAQGLRIEPFRRDHAEELVPMWRESFEYGVGIVDPHPLDEQRRYLLREVVPGNTVLVASIDDRIVAFIAATRHSIAQLYVRCGYHGRGIGTHLVDWAKAQSAGSLWLYTFARNASACAFYERKGFQAVARGFEPTWQLDDVRYEWTAKPGGAGRE